MGCTAFSRPWGEAWRRDAALLVDPRSSEAIAEAMRQLWEDAETRTRLTLRGRARLAEYTPDDFRRRLAEIIDEAGARVRAGRYRAHPMVADLAG
jgi:glycosyltransferase involved in cell wall biosynthesis